MKKLIKIQRNKGMTYVELIVVLSIFAIMSGVVIYDYNGFQAKVDVKNLASDIALKIVEAQKASLNGQENISAGAGWKPAYGVYFDTTNKPKQFIYFADLGDDGGAPIGVEILDTISILKGNNYIDKVDRCTSVDCVSPTPITPLSISFKRPDSSAIFTDSSGVLLSPIPDYIQITVKSPQGAIALIKVYPSGRVQVN